MNRPKLTKRQQAVLEMLEGFVHQHSYGPTIREIGEAMGIASPNGVICHLKALEKKGYITRGEMKSRAIRIVTEWHESGNNILLLLRYLIRKPVITTTEDVIDVIDHPERFEDDWNELQGEIKCPDTPTT